MDIAFPFHLDSRGRTATADLDAHVRHLIEQVLFTQPGERVNRPTFGCGLQQLLFAPNSPELASATQFLVQGALQQWLGDVIQVQSVDIQARDETLAVTIAYVVLRNRQPRVAQFTRGGV
jgi:phage baseplate assembly protein W